MKKILILIFLVLTLQSNDTYTLNDFAKKVSLQNDINIYIDEEFKNKEVSLFVPKVISNQELFKLFKITSSKLGFNIKDLGGTYHLSKKISYKVRNYIYKLKYNNFKDCESLLKSLGVSYTYLNASNTFIIKSTSIKYSEIKKYLFQIDVMQKQVMLKIMIFEYSDKDIKERGVQYASIYKGIDGTIEYALNTIVAPIHTSNPTLSSLDFYGALRLLNEDKTINVKQYPYILSKHDKSFKFEAVENIPYLVTTTKTDSQVSSEQNSIEYKDVGLKISGKSLVYDDYITLDLDLVIEDLISDNSESTMPHTYKRVLKSNTDIEYKKVLLLSGLKRIKHIKNNWNIPYISNIPYLGEAFKYSYDTSESINITIAIEVIQSKNIKDSGVHETLDFCEAKPNKIEGNLFPLGYL